MNEANAAMDAGDRPGPLSVQVWELCNRVVAVTSSVTAMRIEGITANTAELDETPPQDQAEEIQKSWAFGWAVRRKQAKTDRDYPRADSIRALLRNAGWEVRDAKDGSVDVIRVGSRSVTGGT
jgi:cysteinyl-tRNA synthetase